MRTILITGASGGVGAAAARLFARRGYKVILMARSADKLQALADEIGDDTVPVPCDAADAKAVARAAQQIKADHGTPNILLNCAGAGAWKTVQDTTPQEAQDMMGAPYFATFNIARAFLPDMLDRRSGVILSLNSPACVVPWRGSVGYAAARWALRGFHEALAQDLVGTGVSACHVIFGRITSEYFDTNDIDMASFPTFDRLIPPLSPEDCAETLLYLVRQPRHEAIRPRRLAVILTFGRIFPGVARWSLRF
ncbi:MAG: SDR family NAD(P)-dependent oxidoreductase [Alphaproteobacteria bacterium]|nr:SDR family NAD(P)-dependent oxidoreductase [Alphaproteobacteria bacterium]